MRFVVSEGVVMHSLWDALADVDSPNGDYGCKLLTAKVSTIFFGSICLIYLNRILNGRHRHNLILAIRLLRGTAYV